MKDPEDSHQLVYPDLSIIIDPSPNFRIKYMRNPVNVTSSPAMKLVFLEFFHNLILTLSANRTIITQEHLTIFVRC